MKPLTTRLRRTLLPLALAASLPSAEAALTINATRVVHPSDARSSSVVVANPSNRPFAVQTWVNAEPDDTLTATPLMPAPTLFRLDPGQEQMVQINRLPNDLPQDRESLFYFNVQEIPQQVDGGDNVLNIALRTRIKLFHRPSQLPGKPEDQLQNLAWSLQSLDGKPHLVVDNASPYHYTFNHLRLAGAGQPLDLQATAMVAPFARQAYPLPAGQAHPTRVTFAIINDYGGVSAEHSRDIR
ncbi:molecular chaperone [Pseudomonas fakonensis]|uniref:Molecular chaperone n=1 Tax=Pseudomonas fakonensis TaxID=2842355 RepID=A0ABX8NAV8_9PSED|nr:molecular chaperone [Pseudomonas fakonensis]QXH52990.1 molecular chaperone [Pseudomonas fakonensis]